jgi:hypothetical protein
MLRELVTGLVIVFMAGSVILSNIFRSTRAAKPQLPADIGGTLSKTENKTTHRHENLAPNNSPTPSLYKKSDKKE